MALLKVRRRHHVVDSDDRDGDDQDGYAMLLMITICIRMVADQV